MTQQDLDAMPDSSSQAVGKWAVAATCRERTIGWIAFRNICIEYLTSVGGTQDQPPQFMAVVEFIMFDVGVSESEERDHLKEEEQDVGEIRVEDCMEIIMRR
mmetsp:Transcript_42864/g.135161  ORF Transcript_42864/g.135161 Transcript_42864/m.135161 type:complete len:102 (+) Transcript_42864:1035-1340(+)